MNHFLLQPAPAPGRDAPAAPPAQPAQPAQPGQQAPAAPADGGAPSGGPFGGGGTILLFLLPLLLIFFMNRSQTKKQQKLESNLKKGDRVLTNSGLIGRIAEMGERTVKIEIAPGVNVQMVKSAIQGLDAPEPKPAENDKPQEKKA